MASILFPSMEDALLSSFLDLASRLLHDQIIYFTAKGPPEREEECSSSLGRKHRDTSEFVPPGISLLIEMDSSSDTSNNSFPGNSCKISSALQALQKQHEEKTRKIEELRSQIDSVKPGLEKKMKEPLGDKKEVFKSLSEKYSSLREEYNALLAEKSME
ncbi:hypothetical protein OIU74_008761 [Salix koriyanagi]|uniref:Uncharacterized protein n=1 Tax=Salix koriyanagi TaxID=2511006 RepID=A0A9Q0TQQ3_9ROSI|nr:hypothetical protein OIU74_008761 [Salix koriyanagi]